MINILLEPSPIPGEIPLVLVNIPDEDTEVALRAIWYTQRSARESREAAIGIPTTYYDSDDPAANPLSERERHYDNIANGLYTDQGWVLSHTISDSHRGPNPENFDEVMVTYDHRRLGTICLQAIRTGVRIAFEDKYPPVLGTNLTKMCFIGRALGKLFNVPGREAARLNKIELATTAYLETIIAVTVATSQQAAYIRDIRTYEEGRYMQELASLAQAEREAQWAEEKIKLRRGSIKQRLANPKYVALLREIVTAKRAAQAASENPL